jgi:CxxC motif-containing protein (DUF1111 family)
MGSARLLVVVATGTALILAGLLLGPPLAGAPPPDPMFGDPLPGLSPADLAHFNEGKNDFEEVETVADGLGPIFNARSCAECHSFPTTGGGSAVNELRFGRFSNGVFDDLASQGGSLLQLFAIKPECQELLPANANRVEHRQTTPLFGAGLIEAIPGSQIEAYANVLQANHPGQAGQIHYVTSVSDGGVHVGRFGWKSQQAKLLDFAADAYLNEMGITSDLFPTENAPNGDLAKLAACDTVHPDPEDTGPPGTRGIDKFANFMRFLGPPPPGPQTFQVHVGEGIFHALGCAHCHHPSFTAVSPHPAINGQIVAAYSDFLLHDVGTGGGIGPFVDKFRTPPLWGLRASAPYLHDGAAATPRQAILEHDGQAKFSRIGFQSLPNAAQDALLAFLNSL